MDASKYELRRATLDDLASLRLLWQKSRLDVTDLEKRLTEFQVVASAECGVLGALALQIEAQQGRLHSEVYQNASIAPELRMRLWERVQTVARNHGLFRLWTQDLSWRENGFREATPEALQKLPGALGAPERPWVTLQLREAAAALAIEREFELFRQSQLAISDKALSQARTLRLVSAILALGGLMLVLWAIVSTLRRLPH